MLAFYQNKLGHIISILLIKIEKIIYSFKSPTTGKCTISYQRKGIVKMKKEHYKCPTFIWFIYV